MANNALLDATEYASTMLLLLKNSLVAGRLVDGQFRDEVTDENGLAINVKRPPQFVAQDGEALALQSVVNGSVPLIVDQYKNVHVDFGDLEMVQSVNDLVMNNTMMAAASELAHTVDSAIHAIFPEFSGEVGTPGVTIASPQQFNKVHTQLMDQSVPNSNLNAVLTFNDGEEIRGTLIGGDIAQINRSALERTRIPVLSEIDVFASNNTKSVVAGTRTQVSAVDGASQNVNYRDVKDTNQQTFEVDGLGNLGTVARGDIFTIAGVFAVNNRSREQLPQLKQFVVLEDVTANASGEATLVISPPIIVAGSSDTIGPNPTLVNTAFQTVKIAPPNDAVLTFNTAPNAISPIRVAFHRKAISLVSARLRLPFTGVSSFMSDPDTGIGIRYWRGSDISTGKHIHRWDMIFGVQALQRELGARVNGS